MTDQEIIELMFKCGVKLTKKDSEASLPSVVPYRMEITNHDHSRERESEKDSLGRPARNIPVFTKLPTLQEIGERLIEHDISDLVDTHTELKTGSISSELAVCYKCGRRMDEHEEIFAIDVEGIPSYIHCVNCERAVFEELRIKIDPPERDAWLRRIEQKELELQK